MQTYKICSEDSNNSSKTNDKIEKGGHQQTPDSNILKKDNERWLDQHRGSFGFIKDKTPPITTISHMTKQNYRGPINSRTGKENWNHSFYPAAAKWATDFRPLLKNKSIETAPSIRTLRDVDKESTKGLLKHRSTITIFNGAKKQTRDAANLVAPCVKHIHRLVLPPFFKPSGYEDASQVGENQKPENCGAKCGFITKGEHYTMGTQVSLVVVGNPQDLSNTNENIKSKNTISFGKIDTRSIKSITSWDYFDDRLPEEQHRENQQVAGILDKQITIPTVDQELRRNLNGWSAQIMVNNDNKNFISNKKYAHQIFQVSPLKIIPKYNHCRSSIKNIEHSTSTEPELLIPTVRNSSGTLNYNEDGSQDTLIANSIRVNPEESKKLPSKQSDSEPDKFQHSQLTTLADSLPAFFEDSVPKCSLHNEVNCQHAVCKTKSSYLFRRHRYYEAIMDQVHYIKKRIKSLNFTLRDIEHLFSLIEKANEDLMNLQDEPKDKLLARKNKLKWEGFHKKVKSSKNETKLTLDTIKQLEQLFDTVLMNIEICENKFEAPDEKFQNHSIAFNTSWPFLMGSILQSFSTPHCSIQSRKD